MIALLSYLELMLYYKSENIILSLLLIVFVAHFEVPYFIKKASTEQYYNSVIRSAPESSHFPLSIPLSAGEESSGIGDDFSEGDENVIDLSILSVSLSKSLYSQYPSNTQFQEFLNRPFTP